jgi:hypothetical protein
MKNQAGRSSIIREEKEIDIKCSLKKNPRLCLDVKKQAEKM